MSSLKSTSKAVGKLITCKNGGRRVMSCLQNNPELENCVQSRCFRSIGSVETLPSSCQMVGAAHKDPPFLRNMSSGILTQRRGFLGCGDGDEGSNVLSKVHEEKRIMGYSLEQIFAVVAAVDMYQDFLPWWQRSDIIQRHSDTSFDAELEIGFKFLVESYVSHVQMIKPKMIKTTSSQSILFDHLIDVWEFHPGPVPGTCNLHFFVDFKFQSPLYSQLDFDSGAPPQHTWRRKLNSDAGILKEFSVTFMEALKMMRLGIRLWSYVREEASHGRRAPIDPFNQPKGVPLGGTGLVVAKKDLGV